MSDPIKVEVEDRDGKVLLHFSQFTKDLEMDAANALPIFKYGIVAAKRQGAMDEEIIRVPKPLFNPAQDAALVQRLTLILKNLLDRGSSPEYIAKEFILRVREKSA